MLSDRKLLELRLDGPLMVGQKLQPNQAIKLRQRMVLHQRMALEYAVEADRRYAKAGETANEAVAAYHVTSAERAARDATNAQATFDALAAELAALTRLQAVEA